MDSETLIVVILGMPDELHLSSTGDTFLVLSIVGQPRLDRLTLLC